MQRTSISHIRTVVLTLAVSVAGAGCGDDDDDGSGSTAAAASSPATTEGADTSLASGTTVGSTTPPAATSQPPQTSAPAGTQPATTTAAKGGVAYTSAEGDYSVVFPADPTEQTQPQRLPDGSTIDLVIVGVESEDLFVATARGAFPKGTEIDIPMGLQGAQDQAIANVQGTLVDSRDVKLQGRPGREFSASLTANGEEGTLLQRVYFDGPVFYQIVATGAGDLTFQDPPVAGFFESFRFTND